MNLASKLEYSMQPMNKTIFSPVELIRQVISNFINNGIDNVFDLDFEAYADAEKAMIEGDAIILSRALENLIQNSMIHNPNGCSITIRVFNFNDICSISVVDSGTGIDVSLLNNLNLKKIQPLTWGISSVLFLLPPLKWI